jgi:hypothetical protein
MVINRTGETRKGDQTKLPQFFRNAKKYPVKNREE